MEERCKLVNAECVDFLPFRIAILFNELISLLLVSVAQCFISHLWYTKLLMHLAVFSVRACEMWCSLHHVHVVFT